jgi:ATP-binding cassette subfamily C protein/ATP-binding cassette subfamily C protein LapB
VRQLDAIDLRQQIGMVPQVSHFFYGTLAQNLRLACPMATDEAIQAAARDANIHADIMALPDGYETRLTEEVLAELPAGFKQKLSLARAYVRESPVLILDEPVQALDEMDDRALMNLLGKLRGSTTILLVTHRPSHMRLADRLIVLDAGRVLYSGPPADYLKRQTGKAA